jgi:hypothetical protein
LIQNRSDVPKNRASRKAVSALIRRSPCTISLTRRAGTPISFARWYWLTDSGDPAVAGLRARRFLVGVALDLDAVPDVSGGLTRTGIGPSEFGWLHRMWQDKRAAWLVRWPLLGHIGSHVGEMMATRNRMGLSPF